MGVISSTINAGVGLALQNNQQEFAREQAERDAAMTFMYGEWAANAADQRGRAMYEDYMTPLAKRQQLEKAGLSVGLMYANGMGVQGSASNGAQGSGAHQNTPIVPYQNLGIEFDLAQIKKTKAEIENINASTNNIKEETRGKGLQNDITESVGLDTAIQNLDYLSQKTKESKANTELTELKGTFQDIQNQMAEIDLKNYPSQARIKLQSLLQDYKAAGYRLKSERIKAKFNEETYDETIRQFNLQGQIMVQDYLQKKFNIELNEAMKNDIVKMQKNQATKAEIEAVLIQWKKEEEESDHARKMQKGAISGSPFWGGIQNAAEYIGDVLSGAIPLLKRKM